MTTRRKKLPLRTLPAHRFSQPPSRYIGANHGSLVYSTQQALVGSGPSELYLRTIVDCFQQPCTFVVTCLPWIPSVFQCALPLASPQRIPLSCGVLEKWPSGSLAKTGFHLRLQPTLKLYSRPEALLTTRQFHPTTGATTLMALHLLQDNHRLPWFPSPFCGFVHFRVLLQPAQDTDSRRRPNPHEVFTFCRKLLLKSCGYRGY